MREPKLVIIAVSILFCIVSCAHKPEVQNKPIYIAHAGGEIEGLRYTNCLEAVQNSLAHGINHIELDLCMTSDGYLVAAHDWRHFHQISGHSGDSLALSYEEFCTRKIYEKYTPITCFMIDSLMATNPQLHLVTDKISDPDILQKFVDPYRSRVIVECFSVKDKDFLDNRGGYKTFYSSEPISIKQMIKRKLKHILGISNTPVMKEYAFWYYMLGYQYNNNPRFYNKDYGDEYAVFSVDNRTKADSIAQLDRRIKYVYIDNVE